MRHSPPYTTTVEVGVGQQDVWNFLTDFANDPVWTPFTTRPRERASEGLEFTREVGDGSDAAQSWVVTVTVCTEPHQLCLTRVRPRKAHVTDCFRLVALDAGTRVERTVETDSRRFGWLLRVGSQRVIDELLGDGLESLARALAQRRGFAASARQQGPTAAGDA